MTTITKPMQARASRQRTLKTGKISYGDGAISTQCIIRDLSPTGARLQLVNEVPLPQNFTLELLSEGVEVQCCIRRRDGDQIGVSFESPITEKRTHIRQIVRPSVSRSDGTSVLRRKAV